jgi:hypothetical protein
MPWAIVAGDGVTTGPASWVLIAITIGEEFTASGTFALSITCRMNFHVPVAVLVVEAKV